MVSCWSLTVEAWIQYHSNPCRIFDGQSDNGPGFSPVTSVFPCLYISTNTTYQNTIHPSLMLYDLGNLRYLKIQDFCDVTQCQWVCRSACFEGTTFLWIVTHYAITDTVTPHKTDMFSNTAVRNSNLVTLLFVTSCSCSTICVGKQFHGPR